MTLVVGVVGRDGVALAADSRTTIVAVRGVQAGENRATKLFELAPHVGVALSGAAGFGVPIIERAQRRIAQDEVDGMSRAADLLRLAARESWKEWFSEVAPHERPGVVFLVAGYELTEADGAAKLCFLPSDVDFAPVQATTGFAAIGIIAYANYLLSRYYEPERSVFDVIALAVHAISETATQDGGVSLPIQVLSVDPTHGCTAQPQAFLESFYRHEAKRVEALRASFYRETGL